MLWAFVLVLLANYVNAVPANPRVSQGRELDPEEFLTTPAIIKYWGYRAGTFYIHHHLSK
jgi:hypothetical protein